MDNYKKIKIKLLMLVVTLLAIFSTIVFYFEKANIKNDIDKKHFKLQSNIDKTFDVLLNDLKENTSKRIDAMLKYNNEEVVKYFEMQDREGLYNKVIKRYNSIKTANKYLKIMTFRLTDGSTFLRVHKPSMYGDKLNQKRKIIVDTNLLKKKHFGFEVGKLKMTYRVVVPIFNKNKYLGLVEVGIEPEYITDRLNKIYELKNALLIKSDMRSVSLNKDKLPIVEKNYYLARGDELFKKYSDKIVFGIKHNHIFYNKKEFHIDSHLNLYNHKNEIASKLLLAYDTTENIQEFNKLLQTNIIRIILLAIVMLIIINLSFNFFINKIVKETKKNLLQEKQLIESSKLVSMGEMIGNIAHQWRQPLSVISTTATGIIVQKEFSSLSDEDLAKHCNIINDNAQYLSKTIDDFKNFIKGDRVKKEFLIKDMFNSFTNLMQGSIKNSHIELNLDLEKNLVINGYQNELLQCFINIFNNAKDAFDNDMENKLINITANKEDNNIIIKFKDNAGGIPSDILTKIFDPYFTTKHKSQGTGLGLNMTYNMITDGMKGSIVAINTTWKSHHKKHSGAEFIIILPIS